MFFERCLASFQFYWFRHLDSPDYCHPILLKPFADELYTSGVSLPRFAMWTKTLTLSSGLCFGLGNRCRRKAGTFRHDLNPIMRDPLESTKIQDACARPAHCPWKSAAGWHLPSPKLCLIGLHLCRFPEQVKMLTSWFS